VFFIRFVKKESMKAELTKPNNQQEMGFLNQLLNKLGVSALQLSEEASEDNSMAKLLKEIGRTAKILNSAVRIVHYKIYNLLGKLIVSKNTNESEIQIVLNSLNIANGLYIIEAIDENNKTYRKELSYEK